jgi:hypothetical protein
LTVVWSAILSSALFIPSLVAYFNALKAYDLTYEHAAR